MEYLLKLKDLLKRIGIIPQYTEVSLFLIGLSLFLVVINGIIIEVIINHNYQYWGEILLELLKRLEIVMNTIYSFPKAEFWAGIISILIIIGFCCMLIAGWFLSIYHAFSEKPMSITEKQVILYFTVYTTGLVGFAAGEYALEQSQGFWIIFPILNIINSIMLLSLVKEKIIDTDSILDKQAKKEEVIIGTIAVFIIFFISEYIFKNYWAITFSVCIAYAALFNEMLSKLIFKRL